MLELFGYLFISLVFGHYTTVQIFVFTVLSYFLVLKINLTDYIYIPGHLYGENYIRMV